jgi:hypothetical protein
MPTNSYISAQNKIFFLHGKPQSQIKISWWGNFKGPKCEIFHRSDYHDFYTIKSLREGDFGVTIKFFLIFRGSFRAAKFPTHMLSLILRSAGPSKHAEHKHQRLIHILSIGVRN